MFFERQTTHNINKLRGKLLVSPQNFETEIFQTSPIPPNHAMLTGYLRIFYCGILKEIMAKKMLTLQSCKILLKSWLSDSNISFKEIFFCRSKRQLHRRPNSTPASSTAAADSCWSCTSSRADAWTRPQLRRQWL